VTPAARRIAVVGVTGSGKTTFAAALAAAPDLPYVELDALHWEPHWVPVDLAVFRDRVAHAVCADRWVADGNDSEVRDLVWGCADTVVWLDDSFPLVFARLVRRTLVRVQTGQELWNGNRERWRDHFLSGDSLFLWAIKSYPKHRRTYPALLASPPYRHLRLVRLRSPRQAQRVLDAVAGRASASARPGVAGERRQVDA